MALKSSLVAAGVTKFRTNVFGAFTRAGEGVIDGRSIGLNWLGNWFDRGYAFEDYLASKLPANWRLPPRFKTFDFFGDGKAISVKTLDTNTLSRITDPDLIRYQINGYVNNMINFVEAPYRNGTGKILRDAEISSKELLLGIPANTSPTHMQQLAESIEYGSRNGVSVVITKIK
jgi:filamentous hemagglutinin